MNDLMQQCAALNVTPTDVERIAAIIHETNRTYCRTIGDYSHATWGEASVPLKDSVRQGVVLHLTDPGLTPEQSHENWMEYKRAEGWTYGPKKDERLKQHPCFVPYSELPVQDRIKDELFKAIVSILDPRRYMG